MNAHTNTWAVIPMAPFLGTELYLRIPGALLHNKFFSYFFLVMVLVCLIKSKPWLSFDNLGINGLITVSHLTSTASRKVNSQQ